MSSAIVLLTLIFMATAASGSTMTYTDSASFIGALPGLPSIETFEGLAAGDSPASCGGDCGSIGEIDFGEFVPGESFLATDLYDQVTPSGSIMLGLDNGDEAFQDGDVISLTFASAVQALGLFVVTSPDPVAPGEFRLVTTAGVALGSDSPETVLADGGTAYFVGLVSDVSFSSATLEWEPGNVPGNFLFNLDDVMYVPEPGSAVLLSLVSVFAVSMRRRV